MDAAGIVNEIISLGHQLSRERRISFRSDVVCTGCFPGAKTYSDIILRLCNSEDIPLSVLCRLGEVLSRYRPPVCGVAYYELYKNSCSNLEFYSVAVKKCGEWVRVPRKVDPSAYIEIERASKVVYVLDTSSDVLHWFSSWGGTAVVKAAVFDETFGDILQT